MLRLTPCEPSANVLCGELEGESGRRGLGASVFGVVTNRNRVSSSSAVTNVIDPFRFGDCSKAFSEVRKFLVVSASSGSA